MKFTSILAYILVITGALVWLMIGLFDFNIVSWIFSKVPVVSRVIYSAVGIAGLFMIFFGIFYKPFKKVA